MPIKPPAPKHTSEDLGNKLIISIPSLKFWPLMIYLGFRLIIWAIFELLIPGALLLNKNRANALPAPFLIAGFVLFTYLGGLLIYNFAWWVAGKEIIEVSDQRITIHRVALGPTHLQKYSANYIKDLRVSSSNISLSNSALMWYGSSSLYPWRRNDIGPLVIDYGAATFRFGSGVDEAEAKQILAEIQQKYPQYKN